MSSAEREEKTNQADGPDADSRYGLLTFDEAGILTGWDQVMEDVTGIPAACILGKRLWDLPFLNGETGEPVTQADVLERVLARPAAAEPLFSHVILRTGSGTRQFESILFTVPPGGRIRGGAVVHDITVRERETDAIRKQNRKLLSISSTVRHDINNQLTILNGYLSLMEDGAEGIDRDGIVRILLSASDRIERILKSGREYQEIGIRPAVWSGLGETIRLALAEQESPGFRSVIDTACEGIEIRADPLFSSVFSHLIGNSVRHGGGISEIRIRCGPDGERLQIVYEDDGAGIPDKVKPDLFSQGKGKKTWGLFLSREILAVTGITIREAGEGTRGARFILSVPPDSFRPAGTSGGMQAAGTGR